MPAACSGALSTGEGTSFAAGRFATHGMPRRDKQFRSKCSQFCRLQASAGAEENSALASSRSSRVGGSSANTPIRPAHPTREAEITKRRFEYKARLLDRKSRPPVAQKRTPLWRHYVRLTASIPAEVAAVLNTGTRCLSSSAPARPSEFPTERQKFHAAYSSSSRKGSAS